MSNQAPMGRPPKPEGDARTERLDVMVRKAEKAELKRLAANARMSLSAYIHARIFSPKKQPPQASPQS